MLEIWPAVELSAQEAGLPLDELQKRKSCPRCRQLSWERPGRSRESYLVSDEDSWILPISEIASGVVGPSYGDAPFTLGVQLSDEGVRILSLATRDMRPLIVAFAGRPLGIGGPWPIGSLYSLGTFPTREAAEEVGRRLGIELTPETGSP